MAPQPDDFRAEDFLAGTTLSSEQIAAIRHSLLLAEIGMGVQGLPEHYQIALDAAVMEAVAPDQAAATERLRRTVLRRLVSENAGRPVDR